MVDLPLCLGNLQIVKRFLWKVSTIFLEKDTSQKAQDLYQS